jgi:hypothetical protein
MFHNQASPDLQVVIESGHSSLICGDIAEGVGLFYIDHIFPEQPQMPPEISLIALKTTIHSVQVQTICQ